MKMKLRKVLAVVLSLLVLLPCIGTVGSAAGCQHDPEKEGSTVTYLYRVEPTCVPGYDVYTCSECMQKLHLYETAPVKAHNYKYFKTVAPTCLERGYTLLQCPVCADIVADPGSYVDKIPHNFTSYDYTPNGTDDRANQLYMQHAYCSLCKITYDDPDYYQVILKKNILNGGVETPVVIDTCYAKKDGKTLYDGTPTLSMEEYENDMGAWDFTGWLRSDGDRTDLDMVSGPITAFAQFKGRGVAYDVSFLDYYGKQIGDTQNVLYKQSATAPENISTTIRSNHTTFRFEGWDKEFECVTSNLVVRPVYSSEIDQVRVVFFDYDRNTIIKEVDCNWGTQISYIAPTMVERPADAGYVYEFTGMWVNADGNQQKIAEAEYMSLYPVYAKQSIKYTTVISVYDGGVGAPKASYQVLASNGNLAAAGFTDNAGRAVVYLPLDNYTVKCASEDKFKAGDTTFTINTAGGSTAQTNVRVDLVDNSEYYEEDAKKCMCICHSILSPIWIRILNLLYSLFNIRYVCCNDMFATHGKELKYTA